MQASQFQLPFTVWDILGAALQQLASLAQSVWMNLSPGLRLVVVALLIAGILLPPAKASTGRRRYRRRYRRYGYE